MIIQALQPTGAHYVTFEAPRLSWAAAAELGR
jgi:hypothetical protein